MAAVSGTYSALSSGTSTDKTSGTKEIAGNFQDFLLLLTTQLKNQSPLDPLDTNQFTQQLVQFAGVEQQLKGNDTLGSILTAMQSTSTVNAAGYVGMTITADGSSASLASGFASWTVNAAKDTKRATMTISDANGKAVASKSITLKTGAQAVTWDGKDGSGTTLPDGEYKIAVSGLDVSGQKVEIATDVTGVVSAVNVSSGSPILTVGTSSIPLSRVKTVAYK